jgi:hypothetical protein
MEVLAIQVALMQVAPNLAAHESANLFRHAHANFSGKVSTAFLLSVSLFRKT